MQRSLLRVLSGARPAPPFRSVLLALIVASAACSASSIVRPVTRPSPEATAAAPRQTTSSSSAPSESASAQSAASSKQQPASAGAPAVPTTPEAALALLSALSDDSLQGRLAGSPGAWKAAAILARQMAKIGLEPAGDSGYYQRVSAATGANVVGLLRGTDSSLGNEHIVVGAHYDHLGVGSPVNGDSIYNGADDDASGTITVLEVARQLAQGPRPRRTIIFAAFTDEEGGGTGSQWYLDHPVLPADAMIAQLQVEMIGRPDSLAGGPGRAWLTGYERSTMGDMLAAAGIPLVADPHPQESFFFRSDNIRFATHGIVAHTISSYNLHNDYHQPSDDVAHVDGAHVAAVINATAQAVRLLANGERPTWKPGGRP